MNSLIPMLASEETSTSEHVSCLSEPSFLADCHFAVNMGYFCRKTVRPLFKSNYRMPGHF